MSRPAEGTRRRAAAVRTLRGQRQVPGEVGARAAGPDRAVADRARPRGPPGRQPDPGDRVGLDHVRRGAAGVPGPATHWIAAYGGMRTSTARPGARSASRPSRYTTAQRRASGSGGRPASMAAPAALTQPAPSAAAVSFPDHPGRPSAARCAFTAASMRAGSPRRTGIAANLACRTDGSGAAGAGIRNHQTADFGS